MHSSSRARQYDVRRSVSFNEADFVGTSGHGTGEGNILYAKNVVVKLVDMRYIYV
jgi:hypothetical protein